MLVTGIGGPAGRALAEQFRNRGIPIVGADVRPLPPMPGVILITVPPAADPDLIPALRAAVLEHGITLVIPTVSDELTTVADASLGPGVTTVIGDLVAVGIANDKLLTARALQAAGVAVPRFGVPHDFTTTPQALAAFGGPVVVKPRVSRGGRGVVLVERARDLDWSSIPPEHIVQEFASGTEYAPVAYGASPIEPRASFAVVLEKTELAHGRVGNAVHVRRVADREDADIRELALATVRALDLAGPVDIDIRRRADGMPVVLEVNARFGANSSVAPELLDTVLAAFASRERDLDDELV